MCLPEPRVRWGGRDEVPSGDTAQWVYVRNEQLQAFCAGAAQKAVFILDNLDQDTWCFEWQPNI